MIRTNELLKIVQTAASGCKGATSSLIGDMGNLMFKDGYVKSWSPALSVFAKLPESCAGLAGIIKADSLIAVLSKIKEPEIEVSCGQTGWDISGQSVEVSLQYAVDEYIEMRTHSLTEGIERWNKLPTNFWHLVRVCLMKLNSTPYAGIYINDDGVSSTNKKHVNHGTFNEKGCFGESRVFLSDAACSMLLGLQVNPNEFCLTPQWMHFRQLSEDGANVLSFSCNRLDESIWDSVYAPVMGVVEKGAKSEGIEGTLPDMMEGLDLARIFAQSFDNACNVVDIAFSRSGVKLSSKKESSGTMTKKYKWPDDSMNGLTSEVRIRTTVDSLAEVLAHTSRFKLTQLSAGQSEYFVFSGDDFVQIFKSL